MTTVQTHTHNGRTLVTVERDGVQYHIHGDALYLLLELCVKMMVINEVKNGRNTNGKHIPKYQAG